MQLGTRCSQLSAGLDQLATEERVLSVAGDATHAFPRPLQLPALAATPQLGARPGFSTTMFLSSVGRQGEANGELLELRASVTWPAGDVEGVLAALQTTQGWFMTPDAGLVRHRVAGPVGTRSRWVPSGHPTALERTRVVGIVACCVLAAATCSFHPDPNTPHLSIPMTQVAAFGCRLCDGPASFDEVRATWLDTTGVTYLLDRSPPHVRVFDDQGQFIRAFGRSGDGPGELRWPVWLGADTDGRIMVLDFQEHALVLYSPLGTPVGFHRLARAPLAAAYDGALHRLYVVTWSPGQAPGRVNIEILDLRTFALSGAIAKLTLLNRSGEPSNQVPVSIAVSEGSAFAVSEGNYRYRILRFDPDGRPHGTYDRHLARTMLSDAERQAETARRARTLGALQRELGQETAKAFASGSRAPDSTENYLAGISFDALGQLWVRSLRGDEIRTLFDVFGLSRQFLGVVQMKGDVRSIQFAGQYALTVSRGGLDEARVTLWRIPQVTATASRG